MSLTKFFNGIPIIQSSKGNENQFEKLGKSGIKFKCSTRGKVNDFWFEFSEGSKINGLRK